MSSLGPGLFVAVCWVPGAGAGQALVRGRGQGSTGGRPRRGLALMPAPRWRRVFVPGGVSRGWGWPRAPTSDVDGWQLSARVWLPVIPSPPTGGGMECCGRSQAGSIRYARPRHQRRGSDLRRPRVLAASRRCSRRAGQATDVPVAEPVVDQGEQFAGGGDLADVRAAVLADAGAG